MAKSKSNGASKKKSGGGRSTRRTPESAGGMGANLTAIRKGAKQFAARYNALLNRKETVNGEIMADCRTLIEEGANNLGCKRSVLRQALKEQRDEKKRIAREEEMEPGERDDLDSLRAALGLFTDTPLGQAAVAEAESGAESPETL